MWLSRYRSPKTPEHYEYLEQIQCFEVKWRQGRLIGFFDDNRFVIVHGVRKKDPKTKQKDLDIAKKRKKNYFLRKESVI